MENAQDLDGVSFNTVRQYAARPRDCEFTRAGNASRPAESGLIRQLSDSLEHACYDQTRSRRIIGPSLATVLKVAKALGVKLHAGAA